MTLSALPSSVCSQASGHDALNLARLVIRAQTSSSPAGGAEVARDLLAGLLGATGATHGALALVRDASSPATPHLLAALGGDVSSAELATLSDEDDEDDVDDEDSPAHRDRADIRITFPLDTGEAHTQAGARALVRGQRAALLLAWDEPPSPAAHVRARQTVTDLGDAITAVVLSILGAERRRALEQMAEARAVQTDWEQTFDAVSDPISIVTSDFRVLHANAAYRRLFGLGADRSIRHQCFEVRDGAPAPCAGCPLPHTVQTGRPGYVEREELVPTGPDGGVERRLFQTWTYPVRDETGTISRVVEIMKDVTQQERLRQLTAQAEALRAADTLKAELLGTVSHELRSPLAAIKGYAATLLRHERRLPPAERHEFLEAIGEASTRLEVIIDHLLNMSQLETGTATINRFPLDLAQVARDALAAPRDARRAAGSATEQPPVTFSLRLLDAEGQPTDRVPLVFADPRAMREVLDNLLQNAVKYSPQGGEISVTLRPSRGLPPDVAESAGPAGAPASERDAAPQSARGAPDASGAPGAPDTAGMLELAVHDHGLGIPDEHLGRIFDRFHRVDTRLTREVDGLGLGLAICRRIVELHSGVIWAESEPGHGSTFRVLLPTVIATEAAHQQTVQPQERVEES